MDSDGNNSTGGTIPGFSTALLVLSMLISLEAITKSIRRIKKRNPTI